MLSTILCSLSIVMTEKLVDNYVESKPFDVDSSVELKQPKVDVSVDAKPNIDEVDSGVS
jgi:hypothetical protein